MTLKGKKILFTGGAGFLGSYVLKRLLKSGAHEENILIPRSKEHDLRKREVVDEVMRGVDIVIHLAAKVGGLWYHIGRRADYFYENSIMALNLIDSAYRTGAEKFVGLGSVCEYPNLVPIPFKEDDLWNGYPSKITAPYGLSKRMMLAASEAYHAQYGFNAIHLVLINLYGPGDDFNPKSSHVIPALIRRVDEAKKKNEDFIEVWGDGTASREFLYAEDAAEAIVLATEKYDKPDPVNLGSGREIPIKDLAVLICELMDFEGEIKWNTSKVGGQHRRMLDVSRAEKEFDFRAETSFEEGLRKTVDWYLAEYKDKNNGKI